MESEYDPGIWSPDHLANKTQFEQSLTVQQLQEQQGILPPLPLIDIPGIDIEPIIEAIKYTAIGAIAIGIIAVAVMAFK